MTKEEHLKNLFMIGLPESGKTTFLASLWHMVETGTLPESLTLATLPEVRDYLESIRSNWLTVTNSIRTVGEINECTLSLQNEKKGSHFDLFIPDLSGELYDQMFEKRACDEKFYQLFKNAHGILLFIHPNKLMTGASILEADSLIEKTQPTEDTPEDSQELPEKPWSPEDIPTQVKLVDLLQLIIGLNSNKSIKKIAIIISAWDLLPDQSLLPAQWLKDRLPLLWQYLISHQAKYSFEVFGISAMGGDPDTDKESLLSHSNPIDRISINGNISLGIKPHDITFPIEWLIS